MVSVGRVLCCKGRIGGWPATIEIDTGSFDFRVDPKFLNKYKLKSDVRTLELTLGTSSTQAVPVVVQSINPEGTPYASPADAIVGLDFLRDYAIGVDRNTLQLAFWKDGRLTDWEAQSFIGHKPVTQTLRNAGTQDWFHLPVTIGGKSFQLIFDTGTAFCSLNPSAAKKIQLKEVAETDVAGIGTLQQMKVAEASSIEVLGSAATFPIVTLETVEDSTSDGILGFEALGGCKFVLDLPAKRVHFWRGPLAWGSPLERRLRKFGIDLMTTPNQEMKLLVQPLSPAAKAGYRSGDVLVSLGGVTTREYLSALQGEGDLGKLASIGQAIAFRKPLAVVAVGALGKEIRTDITP